MKTYSIPQYKIQVTVRDNGAGVISSELEDQLCGNETTYNPVTEAQAHTLESFILALACQGYDINDPKFVAALQSSLEAIANHS